LPVRNAQPLGDSSGVSCGVSSICIGGEGNAKVCEVCRERKKSKCLLFQSYAKVCKDARSSQAGFRGPFQGGALPLSYPGTCGLEIVWAGAGCVN
jgi:hypothetical protein